MSENKTRYTLCKEERLYSQKRIDALFDKGESFIAYPLRIVYLLRSNSEEDNAIPASIMVSVSKKRFKRAVKRNRIKRLVKEAYRLNKNGFINQSFFAEQSIDIAFIYLKNELPHYSEIEKAIYKSLSVLMDRIQIKDENKDNNP